ncbi:MAG: hypothetical protein FJ280_00885 [Planctomycetes bacterium]|nr:hypothetical protein [Planctomycetota bacterium]
MGRIRVFALARALGVESAEIVKRCQRAGLNVQSHMALISAETAAIIRGWFAEAEDCASWAKRPKK